MRTIYFCGSIRAGRQDVELYARMIGKLDGYGTVLTPFVGDKKITVKGSEHEGGDKGIHDRDVELLQKSDGNTSVVLPHHITLSFTNRNFLSGIRQAGSLLGKNFCNKMETSVNQQLFCWYTSQTQSFERPILKVSCHPEDPLGYLWTFLDSWDPWENFDSFYYFVTSDAIFWT